MSMQGSQAAAAGAVIDGAASGEKRYLFGPVVDFFCLGGISLIIAPIAFFTPDTVPFLVGVLATTTVISTFVNHPHFAFSYQIFYRGFRDKAFGSAYAPGLRTRYLIAGIGVPVALIGFMAYGFATENHQLLGYGGNILLFFVGWHYTKQGYGMLMVDAALKRQYFDETEKRILLMNSYAIWLLTWTVGNVALKEKQIWGIHYYLFNLPEVVLQGVFCIAFATTAMMATMLVKKWRATGGNLPINGLSAYLITLYTWQLFVRWNPVWLLVVPALHSLQYMIVVARYQINYQKAEANALEEPNVFKPLKRIFDRRYKLRIAGFVLFGGLVGYLGFWGAPKFLQMIVAYNQDILGPTVFLFMFWIFINVHHYFLDNVMWRRQNPDMKAHLFA